MHLGLGALSGLALQIRKLRHRELVTKDSIVSKEQSHPI